MNLRSVTITGADDSTNQDDLVFLSRKYPFVEWGILVSGKHREGTFRFPSGAWASSFARKSIDNNMSVSVHLCGKLVRTLCDGTDSLMFYKNNKELIDSAKRIQLNFHAITHTIKEPDFSRTLGSFKNHQFIFQLDGVNNMILGDSRRKGLNAVPLFDTSGGIGRLPEYWPDPMNCYCGYAGGLSPENLEEQIRSIGAVAGESPIWIDVETRVRSDDDSVLDIEKVDRFLSISEKHIRG